MVPMAHLQRRTLEGADGSTCPLRFFQTNHRSAPPRVVVKICHCSPSSSVEEPGVAMDFEQPRSDFGIIYYHSLLQGRGILYADQQLMKGKGTKKWIKAYAYDPTLLRRDFALAMMKLSDLRVLTLPMGQIRRKCSKFA